MDDGDDHNFSKPLAEEYIEQADATLRQIEDALISKDPLTVQLEVLSSKGHFLKGAFRGLPRDVCS
jgi:osomolarity two-component system phosphorelay intermediate protein YPD1